MATVFDLEPQSRKLQADPDEGTTISFRKVTAGNRCPNCSNAGNWRRGVGFEHEKICLACNLVWEPGEKYHLISINRDV